MPRVTTDITTDVVWLHQNTRVVPNHRLPDGVGTNGVFTEGPQIPYVLPYVVLSAHMLPQFAICCHSLPHFARIFTWQLIRGNCCTSATTPFVLTPSGSCQSKSACSGTMASVCYARTSSGKTPSTVLQTSKFRWKHTNKLLDIRKQQTNNTNSHGCFRGAAMSRMRSRI